MREKCSGEPRWLEDETVLASSEDWYLVKVSDEGGFDRKGYFLYLCHGEDGALKFNGTCDVCGCKPPIGLDTARRLLDDDS